jgi:hypothetical protein
LRPDQVKTKEFSFIVAPVLTPLRPRVKRLYVLDYPAIDPCHGLEEIRMKLRIKFVLGLTVFMVAPFFVSSATGQSPGPHYGPWTSPEPVASLNTQANELPNCISRDGLRLYFHRGDTLTNGEDLYVARRADTDSDWYAVVRLPEGINSGANDRTAFESQDRHWLYFASNRPGGLGGFDLYVSWRKDVDDDEGWQTPVNLASINTAGFDAGPTLFEDEDGTIQLYFTSGPSGPVADLYVSILGPGGFESRTAVTELNSSANDSRPYLRKDGREIYFASNRNGLLSIWASTRFATDQLWLAPSLIFTPTGGGTPAPYFTTPVLSRDALTLYVGVNQAAGTDVGDIYSAHREKIKGPR